MIVYKLYNLRGGRYLRLSGWVALHCNSGEPAHPWLRHAFGNYHNSTGLLLCIPRFSTSPLTVCGRPISVVRCPVRTMIYVHLYRGDMRR